MAQLSDLMGPAPTPLEGDTGTGLEKEGVNYRLAEEGVSCLTCNNFIAPDACQIVNGKVAEDGVCDAHEPKQDAAGEVGSLLFGGV